MAPDRGYGAKFQHLKVPRVYRDEDIGCQLTFLERLNLLGHFISFGCF